MELERAIAEFYSRYRGLRLFSTSSRVVDFEDVLYNVEGSSRDPKIEDKGWKALLRMNGIDRDCYVIDPPADEDSSHPGFNVGGHVTPQPRGCVEPGGVSYLMPLCSWHNHTGRNRKPFEHEETRMLELSGYMEGDLAATFLARTRGDAEFRLVSVEGNTLSTQAIDPLQVNLFHDHRDTGVAHPALPRAYLRFRRVKEDGEVKFFIDDARLPILE